MSFKKTNIETDWSFNKKEIEYSAGNIDELIREVNEIGKVKNIPKIPSVRERDLRESFSRLQVGEMMSVFLGETKIIIEKKEGDVFNIKTEGK